MEPDLAMKSFNMDKVLSQRILGRQQQILGQRIIHCQFIARGMNFGDTKSMRIRLKPALKRRGMNQADLANALNISAGYVSDISTGKKLPSIELLGQILQVLDADISEIVQSLPPVAVPGRAGAGDEVFLTDDYAKGEGIYKVERPPQLPARGIVAVETQGASMEPAFFDGDLLFYSRCTNDGVPLEAIGRRVVAETVDGRVWVKQLKTGTEPGLFHLVSLNQTGPNMLNTRVKWAAPILLHLPREFVKRLE